MLYLIYCESYHYCGYGQHFVVKADSEEMAEELVADAANEYFYEQDREQLEEEDLLFDTVDYFSIISVEPFDENHETWKFYKDPGQHEFYIEVNF